MLCLAIVKYRYYAMVDVRWRCGSLPNYFGHLFTRPMKKHYGVRTEDVALWHRTSSCSASYVGCQRDAARICCSGAMLRAPCTAGAVAAERRRLLSIDISCWLGAEQQTRRRPWLLSIDGTDRRTDGRSLTMRAASITDDYKHLWR